MGFTVIMIDNIVLNMARCPHINRAPIYDRCYDKRITVYIHVELNIW